MNIEHDTTIYLLSGIDIDEENEIDFDTLQAQETFFYAHRDLTLVNTNENDDFKYVRENDAIVVGYSIDAVENVNFVMYNQNDKWFYASIIRKEYVNPNASRLHLKLDTFQTYMFDYQFNETFIDREHQDRYTNNGQPIFNIESEQLERGNKFKIIEYKQYLNANITKGTYQNDLSIYLNPYDEGGTKELFFLQIISKEPLHKTSEYAYSKNGTEISGTSAVLNEISSYKGVCTNVYSYIGLYAPHGTAGAYGNVFFGVKEASGNYPWHWWEAFTNETLKQLSKDPRIISISLSKYCPYKFKVDIDTAGAGRHILVYNDTQSIYLINYAYETTLTGNALFLVRDINQYSLEFTLTNDIDIDLNINNLKNIDYEPKLLTSEYTYNEIQMLTQRKKYYNEFITNQTKFNLIETCSIKASSAIKVNNYNNITDIDDNLVADATTTEVALRTDAWLNYLSQNKNSLITGYKTNLLGTIANIGLGISTGGMGLAVAGTQAINTALNIKNQMAKIQDIQETPDNIKATNFDLVLDNALKNLLIKSYIYQIDDRFKNKIFNYFYHYGYKCNDFKTPNLRSRYYFNYIKTVGANITSNISKENLDDLKAKFNNGLTIWHYRDAQTFKGVKNFEYENVEMALIGD